MYEVTTQVKSRRSTFRVVVALAVVFSMAFAAALLLAPAAEARKARKIAELKQARMPVPLYSAGAQTDGEVLYLSRVGFSGLGQIAAFDVPSGALLRMNTAMPGMFFDLTYDKERDRLYVSDGSWVYAYNAQDLSFAGFIDVGASIASLAVEPSTGRLFAGVRGLGIEGDRAVFVFDPNSGAKIAEIAHGAVYATNLAVDRAGLPRVLVGEHGRIRVFDAVNLEVVADIVSPLAASDSFYELMGNKVYVAGKRTEVVSLLDVSTGEILDSATVGFASAIALDRKGTKLWVAHRKSGSACEPGTQTCPYVLSALNAKKLDLVGVGSEEILDYSYPQYHRVTVVGKRAVFTAFRSEHAVIS